MTSSDRPGRAQGFRAVPPPPGGTKNANQYARFIPREELAGFATWTPDAFAGRPDFAQPAPPAGMRPKPPEPETPVAQAPAEPPPPPEPTAEEWAERVAAARQQGYQDGYRDGLAALEEARRQFALQTSQQFARVVESFEEQTAALDERIATAVTGIALQLARQVVRTELRVNDAAVLPVVNDAVNALLMTARHVQIRLHPADITAIADGAHELLQSRQARLVPDSSITPGGCRVESDLGRVDASIEGRWMQAVAAFGSELPWVDNAVQAAAPAARGAGEPDDTMTDDDPDDVADAADGDRA